MKYLRIFAIALLSMVAITSLGAGFLTTVDYATQFREAPNAAPSNAHWLGTDQLGRDRFARILYGTRVSLLLAPAAALISTLFAALIGGVAGFVGGAWQRWATMLIDLVLSLPWLFLLITVRALLQDLERLRCETGFGTVTAKLLLCDSDNVFRPIAQRWHVQLKLC